MLAACLAVVLQATPASARQVGPSFQSVTEAQFIARVRQENPQLAISGAAVEAAAARVRAAGLWQNPSIALHREEVFEAGKGLPEHVIRLELPLELSGRRSLLTDSAERGVSTARALAKVERVAILADAMRCYFQAVARREQLAIFKQSRDALVILRDSIRARAAAGDASGYDHTRIEIELSSLEDLTEDAARELIMAQLTLGRLAGNPGSRLDASAPLTSANLTGPSPPRVSGQKIALVEAARSRVSQHSLALDASERGWIPSLVLTGGAKTAPSSGGTAWGYVAGVAMTLPIFDHGQADKQRAEAALRRARASLTATEHQTATRLTMAKESFRRSLQQAKTFEHEQIPRLEQLLRRAEASYKAGERPVFELLDAHRTNREVRLRDVHLRLQARLSHIEMIGALGDEPGGNP